MVEVPSLEERVHQSLDNAIDNGYDLAGWSDGAIAQDLKMYDSDLEDETESDLVPFIETWRENRVGT